MQGKKGRAGESRGGKDRGELRGRQGREGRAEEKEEGRYKWERRFNHINQDS